MSIHSAVQTALSSIQETLLALVKRFPLPFMLETSFSQAQELRLGYERWIFHRWEEVLDLAEAGDPQAVDQLENFLPWLEDEITRLQEPDDKGLHPYFARAEVGERELCLDVLPSEGQDGDGDDVQVEFGEPMDGDWWEAQFSASSGIPQFSEDEETGKPVITGWDLNWDHRQQAGEERDRCLSSFLSEVEEARDIPTLKRLAGKARFLSVQNNLGVKKGKVRVFSHTLDFPRFSEAMRAIVRRLLEIDHPNHTRALMGTQFLQGSEMDEKRAKAKVLKLNQWLLETYGTTQKGKPHFRLFALGIYPETKKEPQSEDILDCGCKQGEFLVDSTQETVECPYCNGTGLLDSNTLCPACDALGEGTPEQFFINMQSWMWENRRRQPKKMGVAVQVMRTLRAEVPYEFRSPERLISTGKKIIPVICNNVKRGLSVPLSVYMKEVSL